MCKLYCSILMLGGLLAAGCNKRTSPGSLGTVYRGVVLRNICCQAVVQTIGTNNLGQSWADSGNAAYPSYSHVFRVANPCQFGTYKEGDTISFKVIAQQVQNCACCMIFIPTPATSIPIQVQ